MNFVLIISACMVNNATICKDFNVSVYDQQSQMQCLRESQQYMATLMDQFPGYRITRFKCESEDRYEKKKRDKSI